MFIYHLIKLSSSNVTKQTKTSIYLYKSIYMLYEWIQERSPILHISKLNTFTSNIPMNGSKPSPTESNRWLAKWKNLVHPRIIPVPIFINNFHPLLTIHPI